MFAYVRLKSLMFAYFEKKYFFPGLWPPGTGTQWVGQAELGTNMGRTGLPRMKHGLNTDAETTLNRSQAKPGTIRMSESLSSDLGFDRGRFL